MRRERDSNPRYPMDIPHFECGAFSQTLPSLQNNTIYCKYFSTLNKYLFIGINNFGLKLSVLHWINDALMAIFFFFVTLEIKREFLQGELSNIKQALLPIIAAVGGMLVPALFYVFINLGDSDT